MKETEKLQMKEKLIVYFIVRILLFIFSVSVWHQHANEMLFHGNLESNQCNLYSGWFLVVTLVHFVYILYNYYFSVRQLSIWVAIFNILFGAFIVMALKPPTWFFSLKWKNCYDLYNNNNVINRLAMFSYALITLGSIELLDELKGYELKIFHTLPFWLFLGLIFLGLLGATSVMVLVSGGFL